MPRGKHSGNFQESGDGKEYNYQLESWKELTTNIQRFDIQDSDLTNVDYMILRVTDPETNQDYYSTVNGPMNNWEFVEDILEYDWSGEGSPQRTRTAV